MTQAALLRCKAMEIFWERKKVERFSPVISLSFLPISLISFKPLVPQEPNVSMATGSKW